MKYSAKSDIEDQSTDNEELESLINDENIKIESSLTRNVNIKKNDNVNKLNKESSVQE